MPSFQPSPVNELLEKAGGPSGNLPRSQAALQGFTALVLSHPHSTQSSWDFVRAENATSAADEDRGFRWSRSGTTACEGPGGTCG